MLSSTFFVCSVRTVQIACIVASSFLSLTASRSSSSTLALSLASFRVSLALLFSLSFCCLVNSAFSDFLNRSCHSCPSSPVTAAVDDPLSAEQLHAHGHYQNVTEHKTSGHSIWNKIYRYAQLQHKRWVNACYARSERMLHAHGSSTPCALQECLHWGCTLADMLIDVAIGEVGPCDEWLFHCEWAIMATKTMALTDEPFRHGVARIALVIE